jgi:hypothetical protein
MAAQDSPPSEPTPPPLLRIRRVDRLSIDEHDFRFRIVSIYFVTHELLAPGQEVSVDYGFDQRGEPRVLTGVPRRLKTLRLKVDTIVHRYVLEKKVPYTD